MSYFTQNYLLSAAVLGGFITTAVLPAVVVAQVPNNPATTTVGTTVTTNSANDAEVEDVDVSTTTQVTAPPVQTSSAIPTDNYKREELPSSEVFGDFVVGPGMVDVQLNPGESRTVELVVSNRMGEDKIFSFDIEDATASDNGGGVVKLLGDERGPYSLRDYIIIPHKTFLLKHGMRVRIPVTISLPPDAEPGGRYGSVLSTVTSRPSEADIASGARPAAAVISRIGTLFFVTTSGDLNQASNLTGFTTRNAQKIFSSGPIDFDIVVENTGTVHTTPSASIKITNLLGEEIGLVNIESWYILPQSLRTREITWDREVLFGRYVATVEVNLGHDNKVETKSFVFWVIPLKYVLIVFFSFLSLFLIFRFIFSRFEFKRRA